MQSAHHAPSIASEGEIWNPGSTAGVAAATAPGDTDVLTVEDEQFENVLDEPFITVNWIDGRTDGGGGQSPDGDVTQARIQRALDVGLICRAALLGTEAR